MMRQRPRGSIGQSRCSSITSKRMSFFFNDTATTEIYTLSLHDALPILFVALEDWVVRGTEPPASQVPKLADRKSTRLNSSHTVISYAVFCLKKKKQPGTGAR